MGLRETKKERTREALASAAMRLFTERGYEATTIEDIAAAADVSPRTFFRYYPAKEDVVDEIFHSAGFGSIVAARPSDEPVIAALRAATFTVLQECADNPAPALAVLRMATTRPELGARLAEAQRERTAALTTSVTTRLGTAHGPLTARLLTAWTLATVDSVLVHWEACDGKPDLLELGRHAFDQLTPSLHALLKEPVSPPDAARGPELTAPHAAGPHATAPDTAEPHAAGPDIPR
ncbi:transcriptional regulator [Frankia sp. EI5c]|uniref:TetR family transcriptional regulator n=1 Tax=Frankia sp. EI5c TaxID=683316 RepID=UPI0007C3A103|nr:TetR family transcriptional regulator [Frankia sp. EI5c]OAA27168.1 transcriptional regulator [Frankia sp. EI5c]